MLEIYICKCLQNSIIEIDSIKLFMETFKTLLLRIIKLSNSTLFILIWLKHPFKQFKFGFSTFYSLFDCVSPEFPNFGPFFCDTWQLQLTSGNGYGRLNFVLNLLVVHLVWKSSNEKEKISICCFVRSKTNI